MQIGIVGLPNVGKSTLFNALTKSSVAEVANYPFCTIDPNVGIVEIPDDRLNALAKVVNPQKILPAVTEFVDIAGLVKGASEGEGLGNKFLSHIRECDAIAQVVRVFENNNITHVHERINPKDDIEIVEIELILADLQTMEKKVYTAEKDIKANKKDAKKIFDFFKKVKETLENNKKARSIEMNEEEQVWIKECHLLTMKPILYIANLSEDDLVSFNKDEYKSKLGLNENDSVVPICAKLEEDLADMSEAEAKEFLEEFGIKNSGRNELIKSAYSTLGLETYFTAGEKEVRAWTFTKNMKSPQCAGIIHTDFEKGFICADIINCKNFVEAGGWAKGKEKGLVKMEGKEYIMKDGDVCLFKFNN